MADVTPDPIMRIELGFMTAKHLFVASAIGLFEGLASGLSDDRRPRTAAAQR